MVVASSQKKRKTVRKDQRQITTYTMAGLLDVDNVGRFVGQPNEQVGRFVGQPNQQVGRFVGQPAGVGLLDNHPPPVAQGLMRGHSYGYVQHPAEQRFFNHSIPADHARILMDFYSTRLGVALPWGYPAPDRPTRQFYDFCRDMLMFAQMPDNHAAARRIQTYCQARNPPTVINYHQAEALVQEPKM